MSFDLNHVLKLKLGGVFWTIAFLKTNLCLYLEEGGGPSAVFCNMINVDPVALGFLEVSYDNIIWHLRSHHFSGEKDF